MQGWTLAVEVGTKNGQKSLEPFLDYACHPCAGAMLIFSVSFHFYHVPEGNSLEILGGYIPKGRADSTGALCRILDVGLRAAVPTTGQKILTFYKVELPLLLKMCLVSPIQRMSHKVPHRPTVSSNTPIPAGEASGILY